MDLAYDIERPDWVALNILMAEIDDELASKRNSLLYCLANWYWGLRIFRKFEDQEMVMDEPDARDREYHRVILTGLLANGEKLLHELRRHTEVDSASIGVGMEDVGAAVEELRLGYAEWFGEMKPARKEAILREVFGGER